jgi:uncharacterized membrane protein (UPF0136 family)
LGDTPLRLAYHPCVIQATEIYYIVFGMLTFLGSIIGYAKAKNLPSLATGLLSGLVLMVAGGLLLYGQTNTIKIGLILGLLAIAGLAGQFIPRVMMNRAAPQVIVMALLSGIGMVLTLIAFAGK